VEKVKPKFGLLLYFQTKCPKKTIAHMYVDKNSPNVVTLFELVSKATAGRFLCYK
jgi:hypothetical protein